MTSSHLSSFQILCQRIVAVIAGTPQIIKPTTKMIVGNQKPPQSIVQRSQSKSVKPTGTQAAIALLRSCFSRLFKLISPPLLFAMRAFLSWTPPKRRIILVEPIPSAHWMHKQVQHQTDREMDHAKCQDTWWTIEIPPSRFIFGLLNHSGRGWS